MNFGDALDELKDGEKVTRSGWNGKDMYVALSPGFELTADRVFSRPIADEIVRRAAGLGVFRSYLMMRTADGEFVPWVASQTDLLAEDWEVVA